MNKIIAALCTGLFTLCLMAQTQLKDTQIAEVLLTINEGEMDAAKIAKGKVSSEEVKSFAKMMMDEHKQNSKDTKELAKREKFKPEDSDLSESLEDEVELSNKDLKKSEKGAWDRAYVAQQITLHEKALSTLETILIPQAQNAALKSHLQKTRDAVASHLAHAKKLQTQIK